MVEKSEDLLKALGSKYKPKEDATVIQPTESSVGAVSTPGALSSSTNLAKAVQQAQRETK